MDRAVLLVAGIAWCLAGLTGLLVAIAGLDAIETLLPPLAIDRASLGRTVAALAIGALTAGLVHLAVRVDLGRARWAASAGLLLAGLAAFTFVALAVAALTAGSAGSLTLPAALGAASAAGFAGLAYGAAAWSLVRRIRSEGRS